jgi:ribosomal protein L11 methyltransferase
VQAGEGIVVVPAWWAGPVPAGDVVVRIEPGATFGSGAHATTRLCLAALERLGGPGRRILDVGSGSGVLAVVAARLGATVTAVDIDPAAAAATMANAAANGVGALVQASTAPLSAQLAPFDAICANVLAPALVSLAPDLVRLLAPAGRLVVSGLLERRWAAVAVALAPLGIVRLTTLDGWVALELAHP